MLKFWNSIFQNIRFDLYAGKKRKKKSTKNKQISNRFLFVLDKWLEFFNMKIMKRFFSKLKSLIRFSKFFEL